MPLHSSPSMLIAQITDTHIKHSGQLAYGRVDTAHALERAVEHLDALDPRPDILLITGDLVDGGDAREYTVLKQLLAPLTLPTYLIPGNHDDREALRAVFSEHNYLQTGDEFLHYVLDDYALRLIALDTTVPGKPWGDMCEQRLAWLAARLDEAPQRPTVVFMHHPPFTTGIEYMDAINCRNGDALGHLLEAHPQVIRVLCGHVHRSVHVNWHGTTASISPSPAHAVALDLRPDAAEAFTIEPPACHLHYWRPDTGLITHLSFIGAYEGPYPFLEDDGGSTLQA
jgi:Icc protein